MRSFLAHTYFRPGNFVKMSDASSLEGDINVRFHGEIVQILERALRLSNGRELRVRSDNRNMVLGPDVSPKDAREFADALSLSYVHITNLGRPSGWIESIGSGYDFQRCIGWATPAWACSARYFLRAT